MPSTSPLTYIVDTLVEALQADPDLTVRRIWRPDAYESNTIICYPYVQTMQYDTDSENGTSLGRGQASVEIMCNALIESDTMGTGAATEKAGEIAARVKNALESFDIDALATNNDQFFSTRIYTIAVDGHIGNFNIGSNKVQMGIAATVYFITGF